MNTKNYVNTGKGGIKMKTLAIIFMLPFLFLLTSCKTKEITLSNNLDVKPELGYDKTISLSKGNPVKFNITNAGKDFKGEIRIKVPVGHSEDASYIIPIEVAENSQKTIEQYIPLTLVFKEFSYEVLSEGRVIKQGKLNANTFLDPLTTKLAIIADKPDDYSFFSSSNLDIIDNIYRPDDFTPYAEESMKDSVTNQDNPALLNSFLVYQKNMSKFANRDALEFFDYVFIGDSSDLALSEEALENLKDWIKRGGVLLIESGDNYEKINNLLPEDLKPVEFKEVEEITFNHNGSEKKIKIAKGEPLRDSVKEVFLNGKLLGYSEKIEAGSIVTINTLIGREQTNGRNDSGELVESILKEAQVFKRQTLSKDQYGPRSYLVESVPNDAELPYGLIAGILFVYALIAVPVIYVVLTKTDKRNLMWILAPGMAILVILLISQIGNYTWGNKPILNEVSMITFQQGDTFLKVETEMALFNNKKSNMKLSWNPKENLELNLGDRFGHGFYDQRAEKIENVYDRYLQNPPLFYSYKTPLWGNIRAIGNKTIKIKEEGSKITLESSEQKNMVRVKNGLPLDLKTSVLYWNNQYYFVGALSPGEEKTIDLGTVKSSENVYDLDSVVYDEKIASFFDLLRDSAEMNISKAFDKPVLFGYNTDPIGYDVEINDEKPAEFARNFITIKLNMDIQDGSYITMTENNIKTSIYGEHTDRNEPEKFVPNTNINLNSYSIGTLRMIEVPGETSNINSIVTDFHLPTKMDIESLIVDFNNNTSETLSFFEEFRKNQGQVNVEHAMDRYFIFNHLENKYDEIKADSFINKQSKTEDLPDDILLDESIEFDSLDPFHDDFIAEKWFKVDKSNYVSKEGLLRIKILKSQLFDKKWYEVKENAIEIKGSYHD